MSNAASTKAVSETMVAELDKLSPLFNWNTYLASGLGSVSSLNVVTPTMLHHNATLDKESLSDWKTYALARRSQRRYQPLVRIRPGNFQLLRQTLRGRATSTR